jgi:hypothetical protein
MLDYNETNQNRMASFLTTGPIKPTDLGPHDIVIKKHVNNTTNDSLV